MDFVIFPILPRRRNENNRSLRIERRILRDSLNVLEIRESAFVKNFRVSKEVFKYIFDELSPKMKTGHRQTRIPKAIKLACFLTFLASGSYQGFVGTDFKCCLSQTSVSRIVAECLELFENHFCSKWIRLKLSSSEEQSIKEQFYARFGFPGVIGCVDGTHVKIMSPNNELKHLYYNRKGFYSINAMMICDHNLVIKYVDARNPGSNHDSFIWKSSHADSYLKSNFERGKINTWLLGDSGYQLSPYLLTPFRNPLRPCEEKYNEQFCKARNVIERCFGVLKNRFRCIIAERGLHYSPMVVTKIINVCCALHNACIYYKNEMPPLEELERNEIVREIERTPNENTSTIAANIRRRIAETFA